MAYDVDDIVAQKGFSTPDAQAQRSAFADLIYEAEYLFRRHIGLIAFGNFAIFAVRLATVICR